MILDDEEDILKLYNDYLSIKGHRVVHTYVNTDTILDYIDIERPDLYIIDYRLLGNMNGIEVAIEIFKKFPSANISSLPLLNFKTKKYQNMTFFMTRILMFYLNLLN